MSTRIIEESVEATREFGVSLRDGWDEFRSELRSLREMIEKYGQQLFCIGMFLSMLQSMSDDEAPTVLFSGGKTEVSEEFKRRSLAFFCSLDEVRRACVSLGLRQTELLLDQQVEEAKRGREVIGVLTGDAVSKIGQVLSNELESIYFKFLTPYQAEMYTKREPFGPKVALKFGRAITDIEEAGKCLALERPTACVFHLMRVMERAVQRFGKTLGVSHTDLKSWQTILDDLNRPIRALPENTPRLKRRKEEYVGVHANLFNVKLKWRNPVMHPKISYSVEEAKEVYDAVRTFMSHLADLL